MFLKYSYMALFETAIWLIDWRTLENRICFGFTVVLESDFSLGNIMFSSIGSTAKGSGPHNSLI